MGQPTHDLVRVCGVAGLGWLVDSWLRTMAGGTMRLVGRSKDVAGKHRLRRWLAVICALALLSGCGLPNPLSVLTTGNNEPKLPDFEAPPVQKWRTEAAITSDDAYGYWAVAEDLLVLWTESEIFAVNIETGVEAWSIDSAASWRMPAELDSGQYVAIASWDFDQDTRESLNKGTVVINGATGEQVATWEGVKQVLSLGDYFGVVDEQSRLSGYRPPDFDDPAWTIPLVSAGSLDYASVVELNGQFSVVSGSFTQDNERESAEFTKVIDVTDGTTPSWGIIPDDEPETGFSIVDDVVIRFLLLLLRLRTGKGYCLRPVG